MSALPKFDLQEVFDTYNLIPFRRPIMEKPEQFRNRVKKKLKAMGIKTVTHYELPDKSILWVRKLLTR